VASGVLAAFAFVWEQIGGALSSAAVPRVGLGPTTPPLCRYAKCTADLILPAWRVLHRYRSCAKVATSHKSKWPIS
jgi:hypothetical protein